MDTLNRSANRAHDNKIVQCPRLIPFVRGLSSDVVFILVTQLF